MSPESQRIAIAEACPKVFRVIDGKVYWANDDGLCDPLTSLEAMHEAETVMSVEQASDYYWNLKELQPVVDKIPACHWVYHATASQRAEAFLKALGLWKD